MLSVPVLSFFLPVSRRDDCATAAALHQTGLRRRRAFTCLGHRMEGRRSNEVSSAEAVLVGALSSGVNAPTWFVLRITFLLLALCFTAMLALAFSSKNFVIVAHVLLLVTIGTVLFVLLNRFLAEVGLVPVEQQMKEMGIHKTEATDKDKRGKRN
ncbi:uncharacterized protein LOC110432928 isoform X2 [Sorghum bicolor]|uniref:uncharacterized protein LOC110432928 isoform X2 n=1 Tax=Sorghum bicolor TaxID=4558 RepID=UPI000B4239AB|nr:uncharacterized protein LOC110432928 isoform X2 [Sorghum bicolor]|eukprot:XP_021309853.1 uncharacterized protein LOC110432928 isoform X2 [Sorghum bicolor]